MQFSGIFLQISAGSNNHEIRKHFCKSWILQKTPLRPLWPIISLGGESFQRGCSSGSQAGACRQRLSSRCHLLSGSSERGSNVVGGQTANARGRGPGALTRSARPAKAMRKRTPKRTGRPTGAPRRHRGRLGLWVLLRCRLTLAGRALRIQ